jgi:hypothetical protein
MSDSGYTLGQPMDEQPSKSPTGGSPSRVAAAFSTISERFLAASGVCLIVASVASFVTIIFTELRETKLIPNNWLGLLSRESSTIVLLIIGIVCALLGKRLLTTTQNALARTIPGDDIPMVQDAVIAGKPDPIDQYVRLRSLTGWAGTFTKLGVTGLPLVTVFLTLVFSLISLLPYDKATGFLDLAKLTLGAFIGSFVQRNVELRKQDSSSGKPTSDKSLPV